jgi:1,2-diacylglycerol 3-beta-glucosyltransferase
MSASGDVVLCAAAAPVLVASAYLLACALLSRRAKAPPYGAPRVRFDVVVPAHDEEAGIAATVESVRAVDYPEALRRVIVVADNCSDATADRARAAGATVLVRDDPRRGKGYALAHAFERSLADGFAAAIVVVDADTLVSANLLQAFSARLESGARAVQAEYGVRNPDASWRTRLMAVAFALFHTVRSRARERLALSAGLRGNGMCFAVELLREVPHEAFSIVEDLEYGIRLGLAGHRVQFAAEANVRGDMAAGTAAARTQRRRWEGGRARMLRQHGPALLRRALADRDPVLLDLALDLAVPPLSFLAAAAAAGTVAAALASLGAGRALPALWAWGAALCALAVYVARGWWLSGQGLRGLAGLALAPAYVAWRLALGLERAAPSDVWVRTPRERREG